MISRPISFLAGMSRLGVLSPQIISDFWTLKLHVFPASWWCGILSGVMTFTNTHGGAWHWGFSIRFMTNGWGRIITVLFKLVVKG